MTKTTLSWGLVLSALVGVGCTNGSGPTLARPNTQAVKTSGRQALGGNGLAATATFDAPVIDANTQSNFTPGTGSFTVAPSTSGGPGSIGVIDASSTPHYQYVIVGDLNGNPQNFFAVIADVPFTTGTQAIDNVHYFAGLFDTASGNPTHLADQGTVTFTAIGGIGGRWVGSFTGTLEAVAPGCQTTADCRAGELCSNGQCVSAPPTGCRSNADCSAGQQCNAGVCVGLTPVCAVDADCGAGQVCQAGTCVVGPPPSGCQVDSDCASNEVCVRGVCAVTAPQCTSNAQCPVGWQCQSQQCVPGGTTGGACEGQQGDGSLSGQVGAVSSCTALGSGAVTLAQGVAVIDDQLRLMVFEPTTGNEGVVLELAVCPGAVGTLSLGNGLVAAAHVKDVQSPGLRLFAERQASSASLTLTSVGLHLAGQFALTLSAGGNVTGSFTMQ